MKKLLGIVVLGLLFNESAYAGTCKTPKKPKEKFVLAHEPVPYTRKRKLNFFFITHMLHKLENYLIPHLTKLLRIDQFYLFFHLYHNKLNRLFHFQNKKLLFYT